jgi:hypothetical protein
MQHQTINCDQVIAVASIANAMKVPKLIEERFLIGHHILAI